MDDWWSFVRELNFESVVKILWYDHSNESFVNHEPKGSWFTSFSRVLPTSQVGYYAGKPIESMVYCFYKIKGHQYFFHRSTCFCSEPDKNPSQKIIWLWLQGCIKTNHEMTSSVAVCTTFKQHYIWLFWILTSVAFVLGVRTCDNTCRPVEMNIRGNMLGWINSLVYSY